MKDIANHKRKTARGGTLTRISIRATLARIATLSLAIVFLTLCAAQSLSLTYEPIIDYETRFDSININEETVLFPAVLSYEKVSSTSKTTSKQKMIALTFDDGPSQYTKTILNVLEQYNAKATFFVVGERVANYSATIKRAVDLGCEVAGHSWNHAELTTLSKANARSQLTRTRDAIAKITGINEKFYRPPYGSVNKTVKSISVDLGMAIIYWSVDTLDWRYKSSTKLYDTIMSKATDGAIILCHDMYESTATAMKKIIPALIKKGYKLVTISELFGFDDAKPVAGRIYYNK